MIIKNEGAVDRALSVTGTIGPWGWIGVLPVVTGVVGWCPAYSMFGWKTSRPS